MIFEIIKAYLYKYHLVSYSQEGEDIFLRKIFNNQEKGFYVDIGCYHPFRFSNTYYFYKLGWKGINIDANKTNIRLFNVFRRRDTNIHAAISDEEKEHYYLEYNEGALNTLVENNHIESSSRNYKIINRTKIKTKRIDTILGGLDVKRIDFLNIDIEGLDYKCLKSIDLKKYNPKVILIEVREFNRFSKEQPIKNYLIKNNYKELTKGINTSIFINEQFLNTLEFFK